MRYLAVIIFWLFSIHLFGQQYICQGSLHEYAVDIAENNELGTPGSTYIWEVLESEFEGTINPMTTSGNKISIDWGNSPIGTYTLVLAESDNSPCSSMQQMEIIIEDPFDFSLSNSYLCSNESFVTIAAPAGYDNYQWQNEFGEIIGSTPSIQVSSGGQYFVNVENGTCTVQRSLEVFEITAPAFSVSLEGNSTIIVNADAGINSLQYKLQDENQNIIRDWQNSNIFSNVDFGNYWVLAKTTEGNCISKEEINVFSISNVITPNNDGINDYWDLSGLISQGAKRVEIFDRYGKLIIVLSPETSMKWNGKYLQRSVPSETYWYNIIFENGKIINGFIEVKNQ